MVQPEPLGPPRKTTNLPNNPAGCARSTRLAGSVRNGVSRLFEMGKTMPHAASVSGHRSWSSMKRYGHLHQLLVHLGRK